MNAQPGGTPALVQATGNGWHRVLSQLQPGAERAIDPANPPISYIRGPPFGSNAQSLSQFNTERMNMVEVAAKADHAGGEGIGCKLTAAKRRVTESHRRRINSFSVEVREEGWPRGTVRQEHSSSAERAR